MFAPWYYGTGQIQGWLPSDYQNDSIEFKLPPNTNCSLIIFFVEKGAAKIIVYMNDNVFEQNIYQ